MIGPTSFTTNDESGFLIEGFNAPPTFAIPYAHKAYPEFFERFGLTKFKDVLVWSIDLTRPLPPYGPILSGMRGPFAFIKAIRFKQLARSVDRLRAQYPAKTRRQSEYA